MNEVPKTNWRTVFFCNLNHRLFGDFFCVYSSPWVYPSPFLDISSLPFAIIIKVGCKPNNQITFFPPKKNHGISKLVVTGDSKEPRRNTEWNPSFYWRVHSLILRAQHFFHGILWTHGCPPQQCHPPQEIRSSGKGLWWLITQDGSMGLEYLPTWQPTKINYTIFLR